MAAQQTNIYGEPLLDTTLTHTYTPPTIPVVTQTMVDNPVITPEQTESLYHRILHYIQTFLNELDESVLSLYSEYAFYLFLLLLLLALYAAYRLLFDKKPIEVFDPFAEARKHDELRAKVERLSNIDGSQVVPISKAPLSVLRDAPYVRRQNSSGGNNGYARPPVYTGNNVAAVTDDGLRQRTGGNSDVAGRNASLGL